MRRGVPGDLAIATAGSVRGVCMALSVEYCTETSESSIMCVPSCHGPSVPRCRLQLPVRPSAAAVTRYASRSDDSVSLMPSAMAASDGLRRHSSPKERRASRSMSHVSGEASEESSSFEAPKYAATEMAKMLRPSPDKSVDGTQKKRQGVVCRRQTGHAVSAHLAYSVHLFGRQVFRAAVALLVNSRYE